MATAIALENGIGRRERERAQAAEEMFKIISGFWLSRAVQVAATLGIPDLVADGAATVEELSDRTSTNSSALYRLLRGLASFGILRELEGRGFAPTALSDVLRSGVPGSLRATAMSELGRVHYASWGRLIDSVRTGEPAFDQLYGMGPWQYLQQNPEDAEIFNDSMTRVTEAIQRAVLQAYDFAPYRKIVDVGGGQGRLLAGMLAANPESRGILMDRAQAIEQARRVLAGDPAQARITFAAGDFFESVPAGGDLYTLKWIIHDWAEERALRILRNVRRAMAPNARVLLLETVLPEANTRHFGPLLDLNMLVMTGGRERRASEYRALLEAAGFCVRRVYETESPVGIVEATAA